MSERTRTAYLVVVIIVGVLVAAGSSVLFDRHDDLLGLLVFGWGTGLIYLGLLNLTHPRRDL